MNTLERFRRRVDGLDDRFRWARLTPAGLQPIGLPPHSVEQNVIADSLQLSFDPAKGGKCDDKSLQEAAVGLLAQHLGIFQDVRREASGHSEFVARQGPTPCWDVKSPVSPDRPGWLFDPAGLSQGIRQDLDQGEGILLDLSRLRQEDSRSLVTTLQQDLSQVQAENVLILLEDNWIIGC